MNLISRIAALASDGMDNEVMPQGLGDHEFVPWHLGIVS